MYLRKQAQVEKFNSLVILEIDNAIRLWKNAFITELT